MNQNADTGAAGQQWSLAPSDTGYYKIKNKSDTTKLLEVYQNSTADGANVDIWSDTGVNGQQWTLVKEGIQ
ncbi:RICIN domain-containing protein [Paenibacillus sp. P26]|nr:RICIN domain-containing protein [Paenibacillus sp. P26]UUZ95253.1 RICIN domain-containing protein [Paenibacillus sp. P25]